MIQRPLASLSILPILGVTAAVCAAFAAPLGRPAYRADAGAASEAATASRLPGRASIGAGGATLAPVPPALASQLGIEPANASVVAAVVGGSRAALAGLQEHDVVLRVDDAVATPETLRSRLSDGDRIELTLLRSGAPAVVAVPGDKDAGSTFSAADTLPADHPLRRVRELRRLHESLQERSDDVAARRKEVSKALREARDAARIAADVFHGECVEVAQKLLHGTRDELYERIDRALAGDAVDPLAALRLDLEEPLPLDRLVALEEGIHTLAHRIEDGLFDTVTGGDDVNQEGLSERQVERVGAEVSAKIHERVKAPWSELLANQPKHRERLGDGHDEREAWTRERVEGIRGELHERVDCAVERALGRFSERLGSRLRDLEVPRGAELEGSIRDLAGQLEAWTEGFVIEVEGALTAYLEDVAPGRAALPAILAGGIDASEVAWATFEKTVEAAAAERYVAADAGGTEWRAVSAERVFLRELRGQLERVVRAGRDGLRPGATDLQRALLDEKQRSDEAWQDLREALQRLHSRAASDCWKLDGPHLDGRFAPELREKFVGHEAGRSAKVATLDVR